MYYIIIQLFLFGVPFLLVLFGRKPFKYVFIIWGTLVVYTTIVKGISPASFAVICLGWIWGLAISYSAYGIRNAYYYIFKNDREE